MYVITNTDEKYSLKKIEQRKCILISQTLWNQSVFGLCSFVFICLFWHVNGTADGLVFWYNMAAWSFSWQCLRRSAVSQITFSLLSSVTEAKLKAGQMSSQPLEHATCHQHIKTEGFLKWIAEEGQYMRAWTSGTSKGTKEHSS